MKNKRGFTLAELLIVVAIIGVLVAISIPIFTTQLEKARKAVDLANMRSAKAAASAEYMSSGMTSDQVYYYDAASGTVVAGVDAARTLFEEGYGKSHSAFDKSTDGGTGTPNTGSAAAVVAVKMTTDGEMSAYWDPIGRTSVTGGNINSYVTTDKDGNKVLEFSDGTLSYVSIASGSILADVTNKSEIKSIIFGGQNMQEELADNQFGDNWKGLELFNKTSEANYLSGYNNLEYIDFTGVSIATLNFDPVASTLKKVTLSNQDIRYNLPSGTWYYINDSGSKVYLSSLTNADGTANSGNRIETDTHSELKGQTIYKQ